MINRVIPGANLMILEVVKICDDHFACDPTIKKTSLCFTLIMNRT